MLYGMSAMQISLDTNIWIFGLLWKDEFCQKILLNLTQFQVLIPDQVRAELERNLSERDLKRFYQLVVQFENLRIDFEMIPRSYIESFLKKGLVKGDAEIAAFCEWRKIDILVSDNRDFLTRLLYDKSFRVLSPKTFCEKFNLY